MTPPAPPPTLRAIPAQTAAVPPPFAFTDQSRLQAEFYALYDSLTTHKNTFLHATPNTMTSAGRQLDVLLVSKDIGSRVR
jgi:hypothetical protein